MTDKQKRIVKAIYKKKYSQEPSLEGLIHQGVVHHSEDGGSWTVYYIFNGSVDDVVREIQKDIDLEGIRINSMYDCTGRVFTYPARIVPLKGNRVAVMQYGGLDV